jgi:hypothetical protein
MAVGDKHKNQRKFLGPLFNYDKIKENFELVNS